MVPGWGPALQRGLLFCQRLQGFKSRRHPYPLYSTYQGGPGMFSVKGRCQIIKLKFKMVFAIRRRPPPAPPLNGHNVQTFFYPTFFLLQLNPTYMKRILHLVSVKNITFKSSYNWFKIDIHQQLRCLK